MKRLTFDGVTLTISEDIEFDWWELGQILAESGDYDQANLLDAFSSELRGLLHDGGLHQIDLIADLIRQDYSFRKDDIAWFLRELLTRIEGGSDD